jgi:Spy/CpxP family protein refolding chaperone
MSYLRNNKLLLLIIGVLLVANFALLYLFVFNKPESPHRNPPTPDERHAMAIKKVKEEVGFNDQQANVYDSLRDNQFKNMKPLFQDVTRSKEEFFSLIYKEGVSDSAINAYASKIGEKQMALDLSTFRYFQSIKALCTEEQKPKMDSFITQIVKRIINNGPQRRPSDKKDRK